MDAGQATNVDQLFDFTIVTELLHRFDTRDSPSPPTSNACECGDMFKADGRRSSFVMY